MKAMTSVLGLLVMLGADITSFAPANNQRSLSTVEQTGHLNGTVVDFISGAGVSRATILFESTGITRTVISANDGSYQAELPLDVYRITVRRLGFCLSRRALVRVQPTSEKRFDFTLLPCATESVGILESGKYKGEITRDVRPFDYESFQLAFSTGPALDLLLRFGTRREEQTFIEYEGAMVSYLVSSRNSKGTLEKYKYLQVMVTYDSLTIHADKVKLAKKTLQIEANGNVVVEDGKDRAEARSVKITFEAGKPIVHSIR